jgi:hypothetical protein
MHSVCGPRRNRRKKAFTYSAIAGTKALGIYSLDQAVLYFSQAMALYESDPACTTDARFSANVADYGLSLNVSMRVKAMLALVDKVDPVIRRIGHNTCHVHFLHHLVVCLICSANCFRANDVWAEMMAMADRLGDAESSAYALVTDLALSCHFEPYSAEGFKARRLEELAPHLLADIGIEHLARGVYAMKATDETLAEVPTPEPAVTAFQPVPAAPAAKPARPPSAICTTGTAFVTMRQAVPVGHRPVQRQSFTQKPTVVNVTSYWGLLHVENAAQSTAAGRLVGCPEEAAPQPRPSGRPYARGLVHRAAGRKRRSVPAAGRPRN